MRIANLTLMISLMTLASAAHADPPNTVLVGVSMVLSTTTFEIDWGAKKRRIQLPKSELRGYIRRSSWVPPLDLSKGVLTPRVTTPGQRPADFIVFVSDSVVMEIRFPRKALISIDSDADLFIPMSIIEKIQPWAGRFDGHTAYGEPFYLPEWKARLLLDKPFNSCPIQHPTPEAEAETGIVGEAYWVTYSTAVTEEELTSLCAQRWPSGEQEERLRTRKTFAVDFPSD